MQKIKIRKGINFRQTGAPYQLIDQSIDQIESVQKVALCGDDFRNLQPEFMVSAGDSIATGQPLFIDRNRPAIVFTAPASGTVRRMDYGRRRTLGLVEIERSGNDHVTFTVPTDTSDRSDIQDLLLRSGLWTSFRTRPFNQIPSPDSVPNDIFVTAIDTEPLAADPRVVLQQDIDLFRHGLLAIASLTDGKTYVCQSPGTPLADSPEKTIQDVAFTGPHPAGSAGTHIKNLSPVNRHRYVWSIGYQDVVAIGELLTHGCLRTIRTIALAGDGITQPRLIRTPIGANLNELTAGETEDQIAAVLSGSALSGRPHQWLGRYHNQVTLMRREPLKHTWFARTQRWLENHLPGNAAIIPDSWLDGASPLTDLAVPLLRALSIGDLETAEAAGCLGFATEDIAPLSRICSTGHDYAALLNQCLDEFYTTLSLDKETVSE